MTRVTFKFPGLILTFALFSSVSNTQETPLSPRTLREALDAKPTGAAATQLAERIRTWFGRENLLRGPGPKVEGTTVAWAIEAPKAEEPPHVLLYQDISSAGRPLTGDSGLGRRTDDFTMVRLGGTDVFVRVEEFTDGDAMRWELKSGEKSARGNLEVYKVHPDSVEQPGIPKGVLTQMPRWNSKVFEGTERDWWVYVPSQYKPEAPACVMVFQDGAGYRGYVPTVFDNLIAKGDMPVTVGVFIDPGVFPNNRRSNRSFEYDTLSDQYARFLLEEILPEVEKRVHLRHDAAGRAISGSSSGGICAFTVAWERPDQFSKVLSWVGSFTDIASGASKREGGHNYAALIRKLERKPIRVFLQDGDNDLDNEHGNWPLANQQMAKSLAYKGYDYKFIYGKGFHSGAHGRAILPDSLRWLWRDHRAP